MSLPILKVSSLQIPDVLPHVKAILSFGDNKHSYEPEFWEFQYEIYRYLGMVSDEALKSRYEAIVRNMKALVSSDRHVIPIQSFLSSWYWFRKEHQTRLEFYIRNLDLPIQPPVGILTNRRKDGPIRPSFPNAGDVLFRYGSLQNMQKMYDYGSIRIRHAGFYHELESDIARADEERIKNAFYPGQYTSITTQDGKLISVHGDIKHTISIPDYLMLCMSCDWDFDLFDCFGDACIIINDSERFAERLEKVSMRQLNDWSFHHCPVQYFDPYETHENELFNAAMSKDFRFAHQREYRFIWTHSKGMNAKEHIDLDLGSLDDLAEFHLRPS